MLQYLKIKNLALLEEVALEMEPGFTAVTGETGAGKSVLLGALNLLSGARADKSMIRQGADFLEVEAGLFFPDPGRMDALLESEGLPACEEGALVLRRSIHRSKMPRVQINGAMATLAQLRQLGALWIDFHGPREPQKLFQERFQLEMLDAYAEDGGRVRAYAELFQEWRELSEEIEKLETGERLDSGEVAFLRQQIGRIDALDISPGAIEALEREHSRMMHAQESRELAQAGSEGLLGEGGVEARLGEIAGRLERLAEMNAEGAELRDRARGLLIEIRDVGEELDRVAEGLDFDPSEVDAVAERMALWQEIRRKFGGSPEAVREKREELARKLEVQEDIDGVLEKKKAEAGRMEADLRKRSDELREIRREAGGALAEKVSELLRPLGFVKARFDVELIGEPELRAHGDHRCRFVFTPNAGQAGAPLNKIASGGESARVMLALKTVLAEADATPVLVFDEVDANVGGEVGRAVGAELKRLSGRHQVLCITHLPQVASKAENHFVVTKTQDGGGTRVGIEALHLSGEERLTELARMLGDRSSASARAHAGELLAGE